jgi:hypothetical protein
MMPKGRSNTEAYEYYKSAVRRARIEAERIKEWLDRHIPAPAAINFLSMSVGFWRGRYRHRQMAIHRLSSDAGVEPLADTVAKDILVTRTRARNSLYTALPDVSEEQVAFSSRKFSNCGLDVSGLLEIPSYGKSFLSLWANAKKQGLSDADCLDFIRRWESNLPAAWQEEDERKVRKQPAVNPKVKPGWGCG